MLFRKLLSHTTILIFAMSIICKSQELEYKAKNIVKHSVCVKEFVGDDAELSRVTRRQDLEDMLFDLQILRKRKPEKIFIFEVTNTGNFVSSSGQFITITSDNGTQYRMVAVSENLTQTFSMHGCSEAEKGFQDLVRYSQILISTEDEATTLAMLRYQLVLDPKNSRFVVNNLDLMHMAESYYFRKFPLKVGEKKYRIWANSFKKIENKLNLGNIAKRSTEGFLTSLTYLIGSSDGVPQLFETALDIKQTGEYSVRSNKSIFPER